MNRKHGLTSSFLGWSLVSALAVVSSPALALAQGDGSGAVYVMSNAIAGNSVFAFDRTPDGRLIPAGTFATDGIGTADNLGNQGGLALTDDHRRLYVVNAGSNNVSAFDVTQGGLQLIGAPVASGGQGPISLTVHRDLLYVLNAGGAGNIAGFRIAANGSLTPIAGSIQPLGSAAAGPAQIQFSPDGGVLVVTEKATNTIATYVVDGTGAAIGPNVQPSAGVTPFGFAFDQRGNLVVSEAGTGPGTGTASSYRLDRNAHLTLISGAVATTQTAACWVAFGQSGQVAYTVNPGSNSISRLDLGPDGALALVNPVAGIEAPGSNPRDAAITAGGRFLYVRNDANVGAFQIDGAGNLTPLGTFGSLPLNANGIAAR